MRWISNDQHMTRRTYRGRQAYFSGIAAEEIAARWYTERGGSILATRHKTPEGEIDLVVQLGDILVFVEVKRRKNNAGFDSPVTARQWERLANAANHYMVSYQSQTGTQPICRFDVALIDAQGGIEVLENARGFDEQ